MPAGKSYTFKERVKLLSVLRDNDLNVKRTCEETGVDVRTINTWRDNYGHVVWKLIDLHEGNWKKVTEGQYDRIVNGKPETEEEAEIELENFEQLITEAKLLTVKRLKLRVQKELDTKKIADALKLLVELDKVGVPESDSKGSTMSDYVNFLKKNYQKPKKAD